MTTAQRPTKWSAALPAAAPRHPRAWAAALRDRELAGEALGHAQRRWWREALGYRADEWIDDVRDDLAKRYGGPA